MNTSKKVMNQPDRLTMGNHQLVIISQLLQAIGNMRHIDELFLWVSQMVMQRMNIQVMQFWAMQAYASGQMTCVLRTMVRQNLAIPQHILVNKPLAQITHRLLREQHSIAPQPIGHTFSAQQAKLCTRYNLNYWASHFVGDSLLLSPAKKNVSNGEIATPLALSVSLFLQEIPSLRVMPTLTSILTQVIPIAKNHKLLLLASEQKK